MIKFIKSLPYHFKSAFRSIRRNIAMSVSSATAVTVTLVLIAIFLMVASNISSMSDKVEASVEIYAQIDLVTPENEFEQIEAQIKSIANVKSVRFSSKEEQKEIFLKSDQGGKEYDVIFKDGNPLSPAFYVEASDGQSVKKVAKQIRKIDGVSKSEFGGESASTMLDAFNSIRIGGSIFVVALCFLAIFLIQNTIKITIQARSDEIAIMRNVGADNLFIKTPFMLEGMMIGFFGAIFPILLTIFGYGFIYKSLDGIMFSSLFPLEPVAPFVYWVSLLLVLLGMVVGVIGSFLSVSKHLKWTR